MSSINCPDNLSFSLDLPKEKVLSDDITAAVNETMSKFYQEILFKDYLNMYNLCNSTYEENDRSSFMLSEKIIFCEMHAELWEKAVLTAVSNINKETYPHYLVIQKILYFLLNCDSSSSHGSIEEFFWKLLLSYPPKSKYFRYYLSVLNDKFVCINGKEVGNQGFFFWLIETLTTCLKNIDLEKEDSSESEDRSFANASERFLKILKSFKKHNLFELPEMHFSRKNLGSFDSLTNSEKVERCLIALNFAYNIFEMNFAFWLNSKKLESGSSEKHDRPLLSYILWPEPINIGLVNKEVQQILNLCAAICNLIKYKYPQTNVIKKLVSLVAEIIKFSDRTENSKYPFLGLKSNDLARELSTRLQQKLHEQVLIDGCVNIGDLMMDFKPPWFRLLLCAHLLSYITNYHCSPDLTGVYDILEHIAFVRYNIKKTKKRLLKEHEAYEDQKVVHKLKRSISVNAKQLNGLTFLQLACENGNLEEVKALLTFPELNVNALSHEGWTALHIAASKGNINIVRELLLYQPKSGDSFEVVNTRVKGPNSFTPLMCAASKGHIEVCKLLLEHTGSVLLEDINDANQTIAELSESKEVNEILTHYKENFIWTKHSPKKIYISENYKKVVILLCVEMIHSYFCTHRTWDVYKALKTKVTNPDGNLLTGINHEVHWDYLRYQRDITTNICKLEKLSSKLLEVEEFKDFYEIFMRLLSFKNY